MAIIFLDRAIAKRTATSGVRPTNAPSEDHSDGSWSATDIYKGEIFINTADRLLFTRTEDSRIIQFNTNIIDVTRTQLESRISAGTLVVMQNYRITNSSISGNRIVVIALTNNKISSFAFLESTGNIIQYDFTNDTYEDILVDFMDGGTPQSNFSF